MSRISIPLCAIALALAGGCTDTRTEIQTARTVTPPLSGAELLHGSEGGRLLLYGVPTRQLVPETTMSPVYRLRVVDRRGQWRAAASGDPLVRDAALDRQGRRVAMVLTDHRLRITGLALTRDLPRAHPGLAFSADGERLAFVCGDAPEVDVCLLEISSGRWRVLASGHGPRDCPAFSADGRAVLYVAASDGVAGIWRVGLARDDTPVQLTNRGLSSADITGPRFVPLPLGPSPLVHTGRAMIFDTGDGVVRAWAGTVQRLASAGTLALPGAGGGVTLVREQVAR